MSFRSWLQGKKGGTAGRDRKELPSSHSPRHLDFEGRLQELLDTVAKAPESCSTTERPADAAGTVAIRNGKVVITDPAGRGQFPTIAPGAGVVVFVNGKPIQGPTIVTSRFKVEVYAPRRAAECRMKVRVSESKLEAYLTIERRKGQEFKLDDAAPSPRLTVTATVVQETEPEAPTVEDVLRLLAEEGITYGIDSGAVLNALEHEGTVLVARGDPPVPGEDARIEYYFPDSESVPRVFTGDEDRVDLLARSDLVCVAEREVLARKTPARPGAPGMTVTGEAIPAPPVNDVEIIVGPGVKLLEDGLVAVATRQGRPLLKNNQLSVLPVYVVEGDADVATGHLTFQGHILIKGSVRSGIKVRATGDIKILGDAEQASIVAGGSIDIRGNLISCVVRAGGLDAIESTMVLRLEELALELELLVKSIYEIKSHPSFRTVGANLENDGPLVRLLLDRKFHAIPSLLADILEPQNSPPDEEILHFVEECAQRYTGLGPVNIRSVVEIAADVERFKRIISTCKRNIQAPGHLYASYVQNCTLEASGRIRIVGDGCYGSELRAGQDVRVEGRRGVSRGGSITSGGNVHVKSLGSPAGSPTKVSFLPGKRVTAEEVEPNVILKAGRQTATVESTGRLMEAYLDKDGLLQVIKLRPDRVKG